MFKASDRARYPADRIMHIPINSYIALCVASQIRLPNSPSNSIDSSDCETMRQIFDPEEREILRTAKLGCGRPESVPLSYVPRSLRDLYQLDAHTHKRQFQTSGADVDWEPDWYKYQARTSQRLKTERLTKDLPADWPQQLQSQLAWNKDTLSCDDLLYEMSTSDKEEVYHALAHFKALSLEPQDIDKVTFPLPTLSPKLCDLTTHLHTGAGFFIVRGLEPMLMSGEDNSLVFLGISAHVAGGRGRQDMDGNMIVHIMDAAGSIAERQKTQTVYTNSAQPFHNDVFCDILALQTRACAETGGRSILASAWTVYNELASSRPDLIHTLAKEDWTFDTFGRDPPYHQRPLLFNHDGKIILNFSRRLLTGSPQSPRTPGIPPITEAQAEALDAVHFIAEKHAVSIDMMPGDLRFINNLAILHCRDAFTDSDRTRRHLVRLWLRNEDLRWELPPGLKMASDRIFAHLPEIEDCWHLDPVINDEILLSAKRSCGHG